MRTIYILLTRSSTILSKVIGVLTADRYTHVSISFESGLQPMYSSSRKNGRSMFPAGPCQEHFHRGIWKRHPQTPCALYEFTASDESYAAALAEVERIMCDSERYHFNILGLVLCRMRIPLRRNRHYFCSQFVGEVLSRSNALTLPKDSSLMRPSDYMQLPELECCFIGTVGELVQRYHLTQGR